LPNSRLQYWDNFLFAIFLSGIFFVYKSLYYFTFLRNTVSCGKLRGNTLFADIAGFSWFPRSCGLWSLLSGLNDGKAK
jgi:hypothetical protein